MDESDATVFFSPKTLLDHIARHPRPLPSVAGINLIEGEEVPTELRNDFDLQLKKPQKAHPVHNIRSEIVNLPTGTAKEQTRRLYGMKLLFDRTPALELATGAKITGLTWPAKYNGEWAMGWHDGQHASVPTDLIRFDAPPAQRIKMGGSSAIRARTRFKFNPSKEKGSDWLKFDKNEIIYKIECKSRSTSLGHTIVYDSRMLTIVSQGQALIIGAGREPTLKANGASSHRRLSTRTR